MGELVPLDDTTRDLVIHRDPLDVLEEARKAAKALKDVIDAKPKKVIFGGETYLEFEDWQTVGRFYGITPRILSTGFVQFGQVQGWEARAEAYHVPTGRVVASAEAMCLNDEPNWSTRPASSWHYVKKSGGTSEEDPGTSELIWEAGRDGKRRPKKIRVETVQPVPQFQLRSMAQTRAGAKALRNALAWVVVLAGYRPTPAEEMTQERDHDEPVRTAEPTAAATEPRPAQESFPGKVESGIDQKAERDVLFAKIKIAFDKKNVPTEKRNAIWKEFARGTPPANIDLSVLHEILTHALSL